MRHLGSLRGFLFLTTLQSVFLRRLFTFTFMHLADAFIQSDLQCIHAIHIFVWESNPQPLRC